MASSSLPFTRGGRVVAATGGLFLLDSFLPWHRLCVGVLNAKVCRVDQGWDTSFSTLAAIVVLALVAEVIAVQLAGLRLPDPGRWTWGQIRIGVSAAANALVLLQLLAGDGNLHRAYGSFLGLLLTAGLTYGSYLRSNESTAITLPR